MGFLDDLDGAFHAVGGWAEGLADETAHAVISPVMLATDLATNTWKDKNANPIDFVRDLAGDEGASLVQRTGQALSPLNSFTGGGAGAVGNSALNVLAATSNYTHRALATAALDLFNNPFSTSDYQKSMQLQGQGTGLGMVTPVMSQDQQEQVYNDALARGMSPGDAQAYLQKTMKSFGSGVSPGQALMYSVARNTIGKNLLTQVPMLSGVTGSAAFAKKVNSPAFDITNPEDRQAAFATGFGKYTSGSVDGFTDFYLDPTVVGGKALGALRAAKVLRPVSRDAAATEPLAGHLAPGSTPIVSRFDKTAVPDTKVFGATPASPEAEKALDQAAQQGRVVQMTAALSAIPAGKRAFVLSHMAAFKGNAAIQDLLTQTNSPDAMRMVIRNAMNPDPMAKMQLSEHAQTLQDQVNDIRDVRIPSLQNALQTVLSKGPTAMGINPQDILDKITDMNRQLNNAQDAAAVAKAQATAAGSLKFVPRLTAADRLSSATNWNLWQASRYSPVTRIMRSAPAQRISTVDLNRPGDATKAATAMLDRVGHAWSSGSNSGIPQAVRGQLISNVARAESIGTEATRQALADVEQAAFGWYAKQIPGLSADDARDLVQSGQMRRDAIRGQIFSSGDARFSGIQGDDGDFIDRVEDPVAGVGHKVTTAILSSQHADMVSMLDVDALARAVRLFRDARAHDWTTAVSALRGNGEVNLSAMSTEIMDKFNRVWKPTQLLRLGWPIRVITDEMLRGFATHGAMTHLLQIASAAKHTAINNRLSENLRDEFNRKGLLDKRIQLEALTRDRAIGQAHNDIVNHISTIDSTIADLDPKIQALGQRLQDLSTQRAAQGLVYRAAAPGSKHLTTRTGVDFDWNPNGPVPQPGEIVHTKVVAANPADIFTPSAHTTSPTIAAQTAGIHDPGIAALRAVTRNVEYHQLVQSSNADLRAMVEREGQFPAAGLNSKAQLLSALGKIKVRQLGYKAIDHEDAAGRRTYSALHPDAFSPDTYAKDYADTADALQRKADIRDDLADTKQQLTGAIAGTAPWSQQMEDSWAQLVKDARGARQKAREGERPLRFSGQSTARLASGTLISYSDIHNGDYGKVHFNLTSAGKQINSLTRGQDRYVNGHRLVLGQATSLPPVPRPSATIKEQALHNLSYKAAWERAVNDQISGNPLAMQVLAGKTDDQIVDWLRTDKVGKIERQKMGAFGYDAQALAGRARQHVMGYLPTPELRAMAADPEKMVGIQDLHDAVPNPADRPILHGESLTMDTGASTILSNLNRLVDGSMRVIGTLPVNLFSRHPFAREVYDRSVREQLSQLDPTLTHVPDEVLDHIQRSAHEEALGRTREVLYDLSMESHLGHAMRFMAPFYNAWQEALTVWSRLMVDDPSLMPRAIQMQQAPAKDPGLTYTDSNGNTYAQLPDWAAHMLGAKKLGMPVNYVRDLVAQGQYWYNPGFGAPVTIPLAAAERHNPTLATALAPLLPYGAGSSMLDQILPSGLKQVIGANRQQDNQQYLSSLVSITHDLETDRALGKIDPHTPDSTLAAMAEQRAKSMSTVRIMAAYGLPFSPSYPSPYQFYIDQAKAMATQYATYKGGKDQNGKSWQDAFLAKYGEAYFAFTQAQSKSNVGGISPTDAGFKATQQFKGLIAANPQWGGLIAGDTSGTYNPAVQQWQLSNEIGGGDTQHQRETLDPVQAITNQQTQQGWDAFRQINTAITQKLKDRGLRSITQKGAADLAQLKSAAVEWIKQQYPAWGDPENKSGYETFTKGTADALVGFLGQHINDKQFQGRPGWNTLAQYLAVRQAMQSQLAARKAAGGSDNLQDQHNSGLKGTWDQIVGTLKQQDTTFADIYDRWLSNDYLENAS